MFYNDLNVNDILSTDLMPTSFLISGDLSKKKTSESIESRINEDGIDLSSGEENSMNLPIANGSIDSALSTLTFHRQMMNEYHCRNYVAEQILEEMGKNTFQSRVGTPLEPSVPYDSLTKRSQDLRNNVLYDIGSANYQEWLNKIAAMNANYRQFQSLPGSTETINSSILGNDTIQLPRERYQVYEPGDAEQDVYPEVSKYSGGYEYSMPPPPPPLFQHPTSQEHEQYVVEKDSQGLGISELFDISLTGIAFLSFGMFVLQVLMCITMHPQQAQVMQMVDNGDSLNVDDVFRFKREAESNRSSISTMNSLARYALIALKPRSKQCLYRVLCIGNKRARGLTDNGRFLLPVWQLAVDSLDNSANVRVEYYR
ncbi:hypothetical protein evm_003391 [Chilo suppressalis]|nr:hypothetical protein evm_003391 [Chilo suppressalis]